MAQDRARVVGTAGHIDHGKSALVRALTGTETDRLPRERERGITIDLGFAALDAGGRRLAIIDVPGHERFIRNMLAGATGLDLAMLVVAADDSVMPQTREHLEILKYLGLSAGLVAVSKCDLVEPDWLDLVEQDIRALVEGSFLEAAPIIRTSAVRGTGIEALRTALGELANRLADRPDPGLFRMPIDRAFSIPGHGAVVTGTIASGSVAVGDELILWPRERPARVRGLRRHDRPADRLDRGTRAAINLVGVRHDEVERGHELAGPGYLRASRVLSVAVTASEEAPGGPRHRTRCRLYLGTTDAASTLILLETNALRPGETGLAQIVTERPVVAVCGEPFVIRAESPMRTLGGGRVLEPTARRLRRRDLAGHAPARARGSDDGPVRVRAALAGIGTAAWTHADLVREANVPLGDVPGLLEQLRRDGSLVDVAAGPRRSRTLAVETLAALEGRMLRALGRLHAASPRHATIRRSNLLAAFRDLNDDALVFAIVDGLVARGPVIGDSRAVALRDHQPRLSQAERQLLARLIAAIHAGGFSPPDQAELNRIAGARGGALLDLLALAVDEGVIVRLGDGLYLHADREQELRTLVVGRLAEDGSTLTLSELRDLLGTTRKFAVPIGEYLDGINLTRRDGDVRRLAPRSEDS